MGADDGYFPRGSSMLRRVHEERAVGLLYGQRALGVGAIKPVNFIGTRLHTRALDKPFHRLTHTAKAFESIFFGSREQADAVLRMVRRMHEDVRGELPDDAGPFPAGTPYSAMDPQLMLWTVAVMADSAQVLYELLVRPLSPRERDALWDDYLRFGELFDMPLAGLPASYAEFREWWAEETADDRIHLTPEARYVGTSIMFHIPMPAARAPARPMHNLIVLGSLPARVRELYGLRYTPAHAAAFRAAVTAARSARPVTPKVIRRGPNTGSFEMVAAVERRRLRRGRPVRGALG